MNMGERAQLGSVSRKTLLDERSHWLYVGVTESGKTTLARWHARELYGAGWPVIVYDPVGTATHGGGWPAGSRMFKDPRVFEREILHCKDAFVFVDESADLFSHAQTENHWMLRKGRHAGLYFRVIVQRPTMISPSVRTQCGRCFLFRLAGNDAREIAADFGHGSAVLERSLDTGDCLMLKAGAEAIESFNCFDLVPVNQQGSQSWAK